MSFNLQRDFPIQRRFHTVFTSRFDANRYAKLLGGVGHELVVIAIHWGKNPLAGPFFLPGRKGCEILFGDLGMFLVANFGQ